MTTCASITLPTTNPTWSTMEKPGQFSSNTSTAEMLLKGDIYQLNCKCLQTFTDITSKILMSNEQKQQDSSFI
jgi:hypothetical protein